MPPIQIILWSIIAIAPIATIFALIRILTGPRLISKLMFRYLVKRRIAWVSLIAVMLCTAMVLIVISVMGGWLRMFRQTNHALIGDLIVYRGSLDGFSHYEDMMADIAKIPGVKAVTPTVHSVGLAEIGVGHTPNPIRTPVEVLGLDIKQIGQVNGFVSSLHLQPDVLLAKSKEYAEAAQKDHDAIAGDENLETGEAKSFAAKADSFPSWQKPFPDEVYQAELPRRQKPGKIRRHHRRLRRHRPPRTATRAKISSTAPRQAHAPQNLRRFRQRRSPGQSLHQLLLAHRRQPHRCLPGRPEFRLSPLRRAPKRTDMGASTYTDAATGQQETEPARCTEILISVNPGVDPYSVKPQIGDAVNAVLQKFNL